MSSDVRAVLRLAQPLNRRFALGVVLGLGSSISVVALLATSGWLITRASERPSIMFLDVAIVAVRMFAFGRTGFRYAERISTHDSALRQLSALRVGIYDRLVPLAPDALTGTKRGDLLSRLVSDVDRLQDFPLRVVQPLVVALGTALISIVAIAIIYPPAALILLVTMTIAVGVTVVAHALIASRPERAIGRLRGALNDELMRFTEHLDTLVAFDAVDMTLARVSRADRQLRSATTRRAAATSITAATMSACASAAVIATIISVAPHLSGGVGAPGFTVLVLVPLALFDVIGAVPLALGAWREVRAAAERVATVAPGAVPPGIPTDPAIPLDASLLEHSVREAVTEPILELHGVRAQWPHAAAAALAPVTVSVRTGDRLLIDGPSGSGKTTLAHVLARLLDYSGSYRVGGVEASALRAEDVRQVIGLCEQLPYLFDNSIRQNLLFARDDASDEQLLDVLGRVGLDRWAAERGGLDAPVGERGALVSGGQAQRLAVARALLADFPVLVLDEPTANVEPALAGQLLEDILGAANSACQAVILISHEPVPPVLITQHLTLKPAAADLGGDFAGPVVDVVEENRVSAGVE